MVAEAGSSAAPATALVGKEGHAAWVRACHWVVAISFLTLCFSGVYIFAVHPRLYWGEVGNSLTPALLEIPITANHRPDGWERTATFAIRDGELFTASRTYEIFNQNGWARSLHFLAAWFLVVAGLAYLVAAIGSGHAWRNLLPGAGDFSPARLLRDIKDHMRIEKGSSGGGPPYGVAQRLSYSIVVLVLFPLMVLTGLTMSPAMTAAYPFLLDVFGGFQSARTLHFFGFATLFAFLIVHLLMVVKTGARSQLRAMTSGHKP